LNCDGELLLLDHDRVIIRVVPRAAKFMACTYNAWDDEDEDEEEEEEEEEGGDDEEEAGDDGDVTVGVGVSPAGGRKQAI
jgi:hypothetical protein